MYRKILLLISFITLTTPAFANNVKIGIVDYLYLIQNSNVTKSVNEQIDKKKEEFMALDKKSQEAIVKKQQSLAERKSIISASEFEKTRKALEEEIKVEQAKSRRNRLILENGIQEAKRFMDRAVSKYTEKVAEVKKLNLVLPKSQVIISTPDLYITEDVLKLMNSDLKKVEIKFAKPKN